MLLAYVLSLVVSSGLIGLYLRQLMSMLGFVPDMLAGALVVLAGAAGYAALQLLFMSVMRLYQPTRAPSTLATETVSNAFALLLVPYLLHVPIPWPAVALERAEPLIYLGAFGGLHLLCKLATFYAHLEGPLVPRLPQLAWVASAVVIGVLAVLGGTQWFTAAENARGLVDEELSPAAAGYEIAMAREAVEGSLLRGELPELDGRSLSLRLANVPSSDPEAERLDRAYVSFTFDGAVSRDYEASIRLRDGGWSEMRIPASRIPPDATSYVARWTRKGPANWQKLLGLRPIVYNLPERPGESPPPARRVMISAPKVLQERAAGDALNVLVIMVDGLGANHVSMLGYEREVTPSIDRLGYAGRVFPNGSAPGGGAFNAMRSLLTAVDAERVTAETVSIAQRLSAQHYASAAFSESDDLGIDALIPGLATGFDTFDVSKPSADVGSAPTLEAARSWISEHQALRWFCFVRLRELEHPALSERYDPVYPEEGGRATEIDQYDNALRYLDRQIGSLLKYLRDRETRRNTCIIVTGSYGHDFSLGSSGKRLSVPSSRVPIILYVPGGRQRRLPKRATLADVGATVLSLAGASAADVDGRNLAG